MRNVHFYDRSVEAILKHVENEQLRLDAERSARLHGRIYRPILAVKISEDWGKTWKLKAICDECTAAIEPPMQRRKEGVAGVQTCDWCGALNEMYA